MPVDAVDLSARRQQFIPLTIAHLGTTATPADGFDPMFAEAAQHTAQHLEFGSSLDPDLRDANFVPGQIVQAELGPTARDYQTFTGSGTSVLDEVTGSGGAAGSGSANPPLTKQQAVDAALFSRFPKFKDPYGATDDPGKINDRVG